MKFAAEDEGYRRYWCGDEVAWGLIHALGLPKNVGGFQILVEPGRFIRVRVEYCPGEEKTDGAAGVLEAAEFELRPCTDVAVPDVRQGGSHVA